MKAIEFHEFLWLIYSSVERAKEELEKKSVQKITETFLHSKNYTLHCSPDTCNNTNTLKISESNLRNFIIPRLSLCSIEFLFILKDRIAGDGGYLIIKDTDKDVTDGKYYCGRMRITVNDSDTLSGEVTVNDVLLVPLPLAIEDFNNKEHTKKSILFFRIVKKIFPNKRIETIKKIFLSEEYMDKVFLIVSGKSVNPKNIFFNNQ